MGINKFFLSLLLFTVVFLLIEKQEPVKKIKKIEKPKVSFYDSTMYELTQKDVTQIVISKRANIFDKREELYDGTIVTKSKKNSYDTNIVSGKKIIKTGDKIYLEGSVNLEMADGTNIKTEQLYYNAKTKIANNGVDFVAIRDTDSFYGNSLYLDGINEEMNAEKTKFRIKVKND